MPSPKLVSIGVEGPDKYIAVDSEGRVWEGQAKTGGMGNRYIDWKYLFCEFAREAR